MIPRTLVPTQINPITLDQARKPGQRLSSALDGRTIIPLDMPILPMDAHTNIPSHVPLDSLTNRTLVPRSMPVTKMEFTPALPRHLPLSVLEARTVMPVHINPVTEEDNQRLEQLPVITSGMLEMVEPDVMTTGEVNLWTRPVEEKDQKENNVSRIVSLLVHVGLILLVLFLPNLFQSRVPTAADYELARRQLSFVPNYLPPAPGELNHKPPGAPGPKLHIAPGTLNKVAPPRPAEAPPAPVVPHPRTEELPSAPAPRPSISEQQTAPVQTAPPTQIPQPRTDTSLPPPQPGKLNFGVPSLSPSRALRQSVEDSRAGSGSGPRYSTQSGPPGQGGGGGGGGGGGRGQLGNGLEMLTDTQGVNFDSYLKRVVDSVRQNWYAVIPESARLGETGRVVVQFKIQKDGTVPFPDPNLNRTSGKEPLDRAAMSAIRSSSPFEPLPPAFAGPFIELRFYFFYNLPVDFQ